MSNDHYNVHGTIGLKKYRKWSITILGIWGVETDGSLPPPSRWSRFLLAIHPFYNFKWEE